jgi:hypothetical protein
MALAALLVKKWGAPLPNVPAEQVDPTRCPPNGPSMYVEERTGPDFFLPELLFLMALG